MAEISEDQIEQLGKLADKADNFCEAAKIQLPAHIHLEALSGGMRDIRDALKSLVVQLSDGESPWDEETDDG